MRQYGIGILMNVWERRIEDVPFSPLHLQVGSSAGWSLCPQQSHEQGPCLWVPEKNVSWKSQYFGLDVTLEASISSVKLIDFSPSLEKPGTKKPLPGEGERDVPMLLVLLLLFFPVSTFTGLAASGFTLGTAPVSFFSSSSLTGSSGFLATGPFKNPFLMFGLIHFVLKLEPNVRIFFSIITVRWVNKWLNQMCFIEWSKTSTSLGRHFFTQFYANLMSILSQIAKKNPHFFGTWICPPSLPFEQHFADLVGNGFPYTGHVCHNTHCLSTFVIFHYHFESWIAHRSSMLIKCQDSSICGIG